MIALPAKKFIPSDGQKKVKAALENMTGLGVKIQPRHQLNPNGTADSVDYYFKYEATKTDEAERLHEAGELHRYLNRIIYELGNAQNTTMTAAADPENPGHPDNKIPPCVSVRFIGTGLVSENDKAALETIERIKENLQHNIGDQKAQEANHQTVRTNGRMTFKDGYANLRGRGIA